MDLGPQEIFDKVTDRLRDGTGRAGYIFDGVFVCQYLDSTGNKCAVGIFIDDPSAQTSGGGVHTLICRYGDVIPFFMQKYSDLLSDLQAVHDHGGNWDKKIFNKWGEDYLVRIAAKYNLIYQPLRLTKEKENVKEQS